MSVPKKMPSARERIHYQFCPDLGGCRYIGGENDDPSKCLKLDKLLDFNDEMLLHTQARKLHDAMQAERRQGAQYGLYKAVELTDPFEKIDAFTGDPEEEIPPGETRPDCPACVKGIEHYHRKADGSPVVSP